MEKFYESLHQFGEKDLRMFFYHLLHTVDRYGKDGNMEEKKAAEGIVQILQGQMDAVRKQQLITDERQQYVHLVFSLSDAGSLKGTLSKVGKRELCRVLAFNELFSVGPLSSLDTTTGQQNRLLWLMEHDSDYRYGQHANHEHQLVNVIRAVQAIPDNKTIVIWCADNAHDQTGLCFVSYLLRERQQPIHVVNVTELFRAMGLQNQDGATPYASGLIDREHFQAIVGKFYAGIPLEPSQRSRYASEWLRLAGENHVLRLWEDGIVTGRDESALDEIIIRSVIELEQEQDENGFIRAGSVVARVFDISEQLVGYSFISYRVWILVNQGVLRFSGLPGALHQFSLKLA